MGYPPFPAQSAHLCQYAAFLARSLKPSSIPNYLNIIGLLHKEFNLPNPLVDNWSLQSLLTGIKRVKGEPPSQKLPITPDILMRILSLLNMRSSFDASFWAICLVSFFGMLRKSHLLASSPGTVDTSQHLVRSDFQAFPWGYLVAIRWSKTIQFRERIVQLPLPIIPESPLCPATAIKRAMSFTCQASPSSHPGKTATLLFCCQFTAGLRNVLGASLNSGTQRVHRKLKASLFYAFPSTNSSRHAALKRAKNLYRPRDRIKTLASW